MSDRSSELEGRVAELAAAQRDLERRLVALERRERSAAAASPAALAAPERDATVADLRLDAAALTRNLGLAGRTLLVLAGAFLLRALTDARALPASIGVALAFAYAGCWIVMAYRAGPSRPWSAGCHGLAAVLVAFPLLVEATTRFQLLSAQAASAILTFFTMVALVVAAQRRLQVLAWLVEVGGILAAVVLMIQTDRLAPPLLFLVALGVATLWLSYVRDWFGLRWPAALATDLALVLPALRAVSPVAVEGPGTALLVQVVFMAGYLGSFASRTLLLSRPAVDFEVVQTALVLAAGLGGAAFVTVHSGLGQGTLGLVSIAFGASSYGVAFAFIDRRQRGKSNFHLYSSVALVFVLVGTRLLLSGPWIGLAWAALAVMAAVAAHRVPRLTLAVHAVLFALAAASQGGLLAYAATALLRSPLVSWEPAPPGALLIAAAMLGAAWLTAGRFAAASLQQRIPRCALVAALALAAAGLAMGWLVPAVAGAPGPGANVGVAATARTAVLVGGALALAGAARSPRWVEAGWLTYPLLLLVGMKLLLEDISRSRPASLFLAFALYGAALILVPRLRRREALPATPAA
jgi:hypothetical protein